MNQTDRKPSTTLFHHSRRLRAAVDVATYVLLAAVQVDTLPKQTILVFNLTQVSTTKYLVSVCVKT